jgi:hypothetical protein
MSKPHALVIASLVMLIIVAAPGHAADQAKIDQLVNAITSLCLSGTQYTLKADVSGTISLIKRGGQGGISVDTREARGAAAIFDEKLRIEADDAIRRCIEPHIQKVIDAINGPDWTTPLPAPEALVGTWLVYNEAHQQVKRMQLNPDGTYRQWQGNTITPGDYKLTSANELKFSYSHPNGRENLIELGRISWIDKDHFQFKILNGYFPSGQIGSVLMYER